MNTRLNPRDTVGTMASISHYIQDGQSTGGGQGSFTTPWATLNWTRMWTQKLNTTLIRRSDSYPAYRVDNSWTERKNTSCADHDG